MKNHEYRLAGWAAIASAAIFLIVMGLVFYYDVINQPVFDGGTSPVLLSVIVLLDALSKFLGIYALLQFRRLLNERYEFHAVDTLILVLVFGGIVLGIVSYAVRAVGFSIPLFASGAFLAMAYGILGVVYAMRLLKVPGNLNGFLKPFAYVFLAASVCLVLVVTTVIGLVLFAASNVILGLALLGDGELEELEVV